MGKEIEDTRKELIHLISHISTQLMAKFDVEIANIYSEQKVMRLMLGFIVTGVASLMVKSFFYNLRP